MTPCAGREKDVLMLVHNQLGPFRALTMRAHLLVCPVCREKAESFHRLSTRLAVGLRRPNSGRSVGAFLPQAAIASGKHRILTLALVGIIGSSLYIVASEATASYSGGITSASSSGDSCEPVAASSSSSPRACATGSQIFGIPVPFGHSNKLPAANRLLIQ